MPIIIDNFHVNSEVPIDNRFVVGGIDSFYSNRDAIQYKYLGLRIWDLNDNIPYYWSGPTTGWLSENSVGVLSDSSTTNGAEVNYLSRFTTGPTTIGKSLLYQTPGTNQIGVGISNVALINPNTDLFSNPISGDVGGLHTNGNIKTNGFLIGKADYITQLNVSNVNAGLLDIRYVSHLQSSGLGSSISPGQQYVLSNTATPNGVTWVAENTLSVLNSTNTTNVNVVSETSTTAHFVTFVQSTGNVPVKINSSKIQFIPSNGQLLLSDGSATEPIYSFLNSTNTGIYYNGDISFAFPSGRCFSIRPGTITIYDSNYTQIDFYKGPTDVQKLFVGQGNVLKYRTNAWDSNGAVQVASDNIVWHSGNLYTLRDSGNRSLETGRLVNSISTDANGNQIQGVYTYNLYNTTISPSSQIHWSVLSFGRGVNGSVQLASNWFSGINTTSPGTVYAEREILLRSLRDTGEDWSPWVKIWNSGNSGYVPFGAIMMWSGSPTLLPSGWRLCDGSPAVTIPAGSVPGQPSITSITIPDLRERFVVGAGNTAEVVTYNFNTFTINSSIPFVVAANGTVQSAYLGGTFTKVASNSMVQGNGTTTAIYQANANQSSGGTPPYNREYAVYSLIGNSPETSYFLIYHQPFDNYVLYRGVVPANGTSMASAVTYPYHILPPGSIAVLSQTSTLVSHRPNANVIEWVTDTDGYAVGDKGGFNVVRLYTSEIPSHNHTRPRGNDNNLAGGVQQYGWQAIDDQFGSYSTDSTGGNIPHENRPPYYALAFIIYTGI